MRVGMALLAAAPVAVTACGGSKSSSTSALPPKAAVEHAVAKTVAAKSGHVEQRAQVVVAGQSVLLSGNGDYDNEAKVSKAEIHSSVAGIDTTTSEVVSGKTIYFKSPLMQALVPAGKTWLAVRPGAFSRSTGINLFALLSLDTTQLLKRLDAFETVTRVAEEKLGTHYRARLDLKTSTSARYAPYEVWVGGDGYVRRVKLSYSEPAAGGGRQGVAMTIDFSDYGKDVHVDVPPASETAVATKSMLDTLGG